MIHVWRVSYFAFLYSILSKNLIHQIDIDLPRSNCKVNGELVRDSDELRILLGNKCFRAVAPFMTQATMAPVVRKLLRSHDHVLESGSSLEFVVTLDCDSFQLDIYKNLVLANTDLSRKQTAVCSIHIDSNQEHILISYDTS